MVRAGTGHLPANPRAPSQLFPRRGGRDPLGRGEIDQANTTFRYRGKGGRPTRNKGACGNDGVKGRYMEESAASPGFSEKPSRKATCFLYRKKASETETLLR